MSSFSNEHQYAIKIMAGIIQNEKLVAILANGNYDYQSSPSTLRHTLAPLAGDATENESKFYHQSLLSPAELINEPEHLLYLQVFPYLRISEAQMTNRSYLAFEFATPYIEKNNRLIKPTIIHIHVFCHDSLLRTKYGNRHTELKSLMDDVMNQPTYFGTGKIEFKASAPITPTSCHQGFHLEYEVLDSYYRKG